MPQSESIHDGVSYPFNSVSRTTYPMKLSPFSGFGLTSNFTVLKSENKSSLLSNLVERNAAWPASGPQLCAPHEARQYRATYLRRLILGTALLSLRQRAQM